MNQADPDIKQAVRTLALEEIRRKLAPPSGAAPARETYPDGRAAVFDITVRAFGKIAKHAGETAIEAIVRIQHESIEEPQEDSRT